MHGSYCNVNVVNYIVCASWYVRYARYVLHCAYLNVDEFYRCITTSTCFIYSWRREIAIWYFVQLVNKTMDEFYRATWYNTYIYSVYGSLINFYFINENKESVSTKKKVQNFIFLFTKATKKERNFLLLFYKTDLS